MIPTSVNCLRFNFFNVHICVRVSVRVFKFCIFHIQMDRCDIGDVFIKTECSCLSKSIQTIPDNIRTDTEQTISFTESGQTDTGQHFFKKSGQNPDSGQDRDKKIRTDRHRTAFFLKIRTESRQLTKSRQTESGQTDTGQKIRTESGQRTDTGHDFPENPDKNETRTGHGQYCPPTSVIITKIL